jgi:hypothetical protein
MAHSFNRQLREFDATARTYIQALQVPGTPYVVARQIAQSRAWSSAERLRLERDAADYRLHYDQSYLAWTGMLAEADPASSYSTFSPRHAAVVLLLLGATAAVGYVLATLHLQWAPLPASLAGAAATAVLFFPMWAGAGEVVPEEAGKPRVKAASLRVLFTSVLILWVSVLLAYLIRWAANGRAAITDLPAGLLLISLLFLSPALAAILAEQITVFSWGNLAAKRWAACMYCLGLCDQIKTLADDAERKLPTPALPPASEGSRAARYRAL